MGAPSRHRSNILNAAVTLFRRKGYAATGLNDILQQSHAPKGSLYHYFPQGKEQLGEEAAQLAGAVVSQTLRTLGEVGSLGIRGWLPAGHNAAGNNAAIRAYGRCRPTGIQ